MSFNPNIGTALLTVGDVTVDLTWKTETQGSEITGQLRFRGRHVDAMTTLDRPCRGSDVGTLLEGLLTMGQREFYLDRDDTEDIFRPAIREIRGKLAEDYGIT